MGVVTTIPVTTMNLSKVGAPADTIDMYEMYYTGSYSYGYSYYRANQSSIASNYSGGGLPNYPNVLATSWCSSALDAQITIGAHTGRTNFGFADGHVKSMDRGQLMACDLGLWVCGSACNRWSIQP